MVALRQRALITLALDSGLRLAELCALELGQVVEDLSDGRVRIRSSSYLVAEQAKGGERGAGPFQIPLRARRALRPYVLALRAAAWVPWHGSSPLFVGHRGQGGRAGHAQLSPRAAQRDWTEVQIRARLRVHYPFHSLRHDAASRLRAAGADAFDLMRALRWRELNTAARYVHDFDAAARAAELAERAAR